ncbi:NACHT domain-containing protein [Lonsdalea quercina]|uniref:NACHT domain-containing protein n=1 Tax=Lonsdalea quercina TaxID=71657 RepID=UPI0039764182
MSISDVIGRLDNHVSSFLDKKEVVYARKAAEAVCKIILINSDNTEKSTVNKLQALIDSINNSSTGINDFHIKKIKQEIRVLADYGNEDAHDKENLNEIEIQKVKSSLITLLMLVFDSPDHVNIDHKLPRNIIRLINRPVIPEENWKCDLIVSLVYPNRYFKKSNKKDFIFYNINESEKINIGLLFINRNVTFKQVLISAYISENIDNLSSLTVIFPLEYSNTTKSPIKGRKDYIERLSKEILTRNKINCNYEFYEDYIWNRCLPNHIKSKDESNRSSNDIFIDQRLYSDGKSILSLDFVDSIKRNTIEGKKPLYFIFGEGGVGKTTFCDEAVRRINHHSGYEIKKKAILLSSYDIPDDVLNFDAVSSVQDLYALIYLGNDEIIDKDALSLNISSGNIIIIIDGLDEIISKLKGKFAIDKFIESARELNNTYLNCSIVISSREVEINPIYGDSVDVFRLEGFDKELVYKYIKRRFNNAEKAEMNIMKKIEEINADGKITPLILRLICDLHQDSVRIGSSIKSSKYFKIGKPLDSVIYQLIDREIDKQSLDLTCDQYFDILKTMVFEYNGRIKEAELSDLAKYIMEEGKEFKTNELWNSFLLSPLFKREGECIFLRYDSLDFWVKSRYISYILNANENKGDLIKDSTIELTLSQNCFKGGSLIKDISANRNEDTLLYERYIVSKIKKEKNLGINERKLLSSLGYLALEKNNSNKDLNMDKIKFIYSVEEGREVIDGLTIFGDFYPLNFQSTTVRNGYFDNYTEFYKSSFPQGKRVFELCEILNVSESEMRGVPFSKENFGADCVLCHEIINSLDINEKSHKNKMEKLECDLKKIFKVGYRNRSFSWKSIDVYKQQCASLNARVSLTNLLEKICSTGILIKEASQSSSGHGYKVSEKYQKEVQDFLTQNIISDSLSSLIDLVI